MSATPIVWTPRSALNARPEPQARRSISLEARVALGVVGAAWLASGVEIDWAALRAERVVYEDDAALVLDKPAGVALTGARDGVDIVAAAKAAGEWLQPAHRLDRVTSGAVLWARTPEAHGPLTQQFRDRSVDKEYLAIVEGCDLPERGTIDLPLRAGRKNTVRVAAPRDSIVFDEWALRWWAPEPFSDDARAATTQFERVWAGEARSLLRVRPTTGRRHQIRVHFAWIGHPVVGDPLFGDPGSRTALHSLRLVFDSPASDASERVDVRCEPDDAFWHPIADAGRRRLA
jgi:tRNA pseudouridine32 synthase/23S rRNA pseudouridine746 synthase/23S rRNA pseudouridine1911/1915/1917 synthase